MSEIRAASWNVEGRLSNAESLKRGKPTDIINAIKSINSDILVLLEAHSENSVDELNALKGLKAIGYHVYNVPYNDDLKSRTDAYTTQL